ncbi:hypothetical protein GIB67_017100 [Kingdonia uniflora]|uniref:Uncharacterized protein n=1 Tax=Kingdonia uniflora TaxID=39325 RepID=A0A7J7NCM0_9MAGN|nr:hypothetical protein GIB67_017100 [Kingdonia uniflora]
MLELCLEIRTTCIFGLLVYKEDLCYFVNYLLGRESSYLYSQHFFQELKEEVGLVAGAREEVKKLSTTFKKIHAVLDDAEKQQIKNKSVKHWIGELKDVAYDIDDVVDEWRSRILKSQVNGVDIGKKKVWSYLSSPCYLYSKASLHRDIGHRIKKLRERLDVIASEKDKYDFKLSNETEVPEARLETSSMIISEICGRDKERDTIVSKLVSEGSHHNVGVPVVSIVSMGGIGKTTLAQLVFSDDKVISHFEKRVWVYVSDPFDVIKLAKTIVKHLGGNFRDDIKWCDLHQLLCNSIKGKQLLLVLDDVWTKDYEKWNHLKATVNGGARGSRIVVTTRSERVALMMGWNHIHNLGLLSEDDSWSLFSGIAFPGRRKEERDKLEKIGMEITKKCGCLPLALKSVGSLMLFKRTSQQWRDKDEKIRKDFLIKMWMSQGFLTSKGKRELESIGAEYFDILAMRSFFQDFIRDVEGNITKFKMHDIVHELAQILTQNECLLMENDEFKNSKVCHLTAWKLRDANFIFSANNIRTLRRGEESILGLFHQLTCLRVLDLSYGFELKQLPETITNLYNLQTLILNHCSELCELPQGMGKLVNLRHLGIERTFKLEFLPQGIGRMRSLRSLSKFIAGGGCNIGDLKNHNLLQRKLEIKRLERVTNKDEAKEVELKDKQYLRYLQLSFEWNDSSETSEVERIEGVLDGMEPHDNLTKLRIESYIGSKFPRWMMSGTTLSNLRVLFVNQCNCVQLPLLESLEKLKISNMSDVKRIGSEFFLGIDSSDGVERSFPKLESFEVAMMENLEEWDLSMKDVMPRLKHLDVFECTKLKRILALGNLEVLKTLLISGISSLKCIGGELFGISNREDGGESTPTVVFPKLKELEFGYADQWEEWEMMNRKEITIMPCLLETLSLRNDSGDLLKEIPASNNLNSLTITYAECVSFPQGLAQLKSLQRLSIRECTKLERLPQEFQHLTSLQQLDIINCDILGPRCQKGGEDWNIISHIPNIQVEGEDLVNNLEKIKLQLTLVTLRITLEMIE